MVKTATIMPYIKNIQEIYKALDKPPSPTPPPPPCAWLKNNLDLTKIKIFVNTILVKVFLKQKKNF